MKREWIVCSLDHEGFPLLLRYPKGLDFEVLQKGRPVSAVLTHTFNFRRFDGLPESRYNKTLEDLDLWIIEQLTGTARGEIVLIETFGGERNYYFYTEATANAQELLSDIKSRFDGQRFALDCEDDPTWTVIRRYHADYIDGA